MEGQTEVQPGDPRQKRGAGCKGTSLLQGLRLLIKTLTHATHRQPARRSRTQTSPCETAGSCFLCTTTRFPLYRILHYPRDGGRASHLLARLPMHHPRPGRNLWCSGLSAVQTPTPVTVSRFTIGGFHTQQFLPSTGKPSSHTQMALPGKCDISGGLI